MCDFVHPGRIIKFRLPMRSASEGKRGETASIRRLLSRHRNCPSWRRSPPSRTLLGDSHHDSCQRHRRQENCHCELRGVRPQPSPGPRRHVSQQGLTGTGLGEAILYWDGVRHHPIASEGGHVDFAPRTDQEIELLCYLRAKVGGRVSVERVLSGPGFHDIYCFLRDSGHAAESAQIAALLRTQDPNPIITRLGLAGEDPLCVATLQLF
jgi:hypothetical protein